MEFKDYAVLGVPRDAGEDEISVPSAKLARKAPPDVNKAADAAARMQEINEAYDVLRDPGEARRLRPGRPGPPGGQEFSPPRMGTPASSSAGAPGREADFGDHSDFSRRCSVPPAAVAKRQWPRHGAAGLRGEDHHARITIPLEDAFQGATRTLTLRRPELDASGHVVLRERELSVKIPRGIRAGQQIRLSGQGMPGLGGEAAGDLYLEVEFEPHARYRVDGRDLYVTLRVTPWELPSARRSRCPRPTAWSSSPCLPARRAAASCAFVGAGSRRHAG